MTERELAAFHEILGGEDSSLSRCNEVLSFLLMGLNGCRSSGDGDLWHPLQLERGSCIENVKHLLSYMRGPPQRTVGLDRP